MARLYADNINTKLAASISDTDTTITVVDATGMPSPTGGDFALVTLTQGATVEKVLMTARSGTTLTVTRGAEGSTPANFTTAATVIIAATASSFDAPGSTGQVIVNDGGSLTGDAGLTYNASTNVLTNTDGQVVLTGGTRTTSAPLIDATQTWNASGETFTGLRVNVTDTASAAASNLLDLQVGGTSRFRFSKTGVVFGGDSGSVTMNNSIGTEVRWLNAFVRLTASAVLLDSGSGGGYTIEVSNAEAVRINGGILQFGGTTWLHNEAANTLALRNTTNAQTFRLYNTWSSAGANFERTRLSWVSNVFTLGTEKAGTGVARPMELQTDGTTALTLTTAQKAEFAATIKTGAPSGGTAAEWKLGTVASVSPTSPNRTIEVDIGGTIYYLAAKTTND
jgi:hypothetical protein